MSGIVLPEDYKYVLAVIATSGLVSTWHGLQVGKARKRANVPYPNAYASANEAATSVEKYRFNCAQRAHANYVENWVVTVPLIAIGGLKYPVYSAAAGSLWLVGRILYAIGYQDTTKKEGSGRYKGAINHLGQVGVLGLTAYTLFQLFA